MIDFTKRIWLHAIAIVAEARNKCAPGERFEALNLVMGDLEDARRRDQLIMPDFPAVCPDCGQHCETHNGESDCAALQPGEAKGAEPLSLGRVKVPEGQTPLNDKLGHRLLDVFNEGIKARDAGTGSPYHGHSLEGCIHAAGWVQRDLRLALNSAHAALRALAGDGRRRQMKALIVGGPNRGQVVDIEVTPASVLELVEVCDRVRGESFWFKVEADVQDKHEYVMRELCRAYEYLMKGETHRQHVKKNGKL